MVSLESASLSADLNKLNKPVRQDPGWAEAGFNFLCLIGGFLMNI